MTKILIKQGLFLTMDETVDLIDGHMVIEDGQITKVQAGVPDQEETFDQVVNIPKRLYMPGLINTHNHAAMSLLRGVGDDLALQVWLEEKMWPNEAKFTDESVYWGSALSIVEMLKSGTTTFLDMYDRMDQVAKAAEQIGIRACLTRGMINFGGEEEGRAKLAEAEAFARNWHNQAEGRITTMMSPHAPYTCPPAFIAQVVEAAQQLHLPLHTHMSETLHEVLDNEKRYGQRPVAHLNALGFFDGPSLVAHAVHLTDEELDILQDKQVKISHNIGSNLKLASGVARVTDMLKRNICVSLGTDSSASNNNLDMFEEVRLAALVHKGVSGDPTAVPAFTALEMGTVRGAEALFLPQLGKLAAGWKADFISIDLDQPHLCPASDYVSHMVYAASGADVRDVWVDGRQVVKNREMLTVDEDQVKYAFTKCYERLFADT